MPRAFLIKKKQCARSCGSPGSTKRSWADPEDDIDRANDMDSPLLQNQLTPQFAISADTRGPYDLSMKHRNSEETSLINLIVDRRTSHSPIRPSTTPSPTTLVAPKAIKPTLKTLDEINASRSTWHRQMMAPYLQFNYPMYAYPTRPDVYSMNSSSYLASQHSSLPPPLVPLSTSTSGNISRDRYSPSQERYSPYEVSSRGGYSPPVGNSPSPPATYYGWTSDGQDSGLASSPSPSSEDGENISNPKQTQQSRYQCPDCNKSYSTYSGLSKHRLMHCSTQVKKSFNCKYCDKVYVSLGALKMHIRTHTLPCKCKTCGKAFSRPWLLQGHIRTHTGEKPFSCPHCSRAFADRSNLRAHLQTHSEVKKYRCQTCSKTFSRMSLLLKHGDGGCTGSPPQQ